MSAEPARPDEQVVTPKPTRRQFTRSAPSERLAPDAAVRQGQVTSLALKAFGERNRVLAFLNTHDHALGGRPLDLAVAGASGLAAVVDVLADRARLASSASVVAVTDHVLPIDEPSRQAAYQGDDPCSRHSKEQACPAQLT